MKKALLINVDSRFNIALRRLWSCYESQGWEVEELDLRLPAYPHGKRRMVMAYDSDVAWVSNLFDVNADRVSVIGCPAVDYGGIGSRHPDKRLPEQAERSPIHYEPGEDTAYGFLTRGCIRSCWFCKVPQYEGGLRECCTIQAVVGDKHKVVLMDNNLLAYGKAVESLEWLIDHKIVADVNQGLDWRLVTKDSLEALARLRHAGPYTFAFDDLRYKGGVDGAIGMIRKYVGRPWATRWYCYYHPGSYGGFKGLVERTEWCREHEALPYVMRDAACWSMPEREREFITDYAAYCNQPAFFKKMGFADFLGLRHRDSARIASSKKIYEEARS